MRVYAASASAAVRRTLAALIPLSGHAVSDADEAEWCLSDALHPVTGLPKEVPCLILGGNGPDAVALPLRPQQLLRLLAMRRTGPRPVLGDGWRIDTHARALTHPQHAAISLTEKESALLAALAAAHPKPISRESLLTTVWGVRPEIDTHTLETHIYRLRQKLAQTPHSPCDVVTEEGHYRLRTQEITG